MTTPTERARALRWAGEFIKELAAAGELSEKRKHEALVILRHYPSATEIDLQFSYFQSRREHSMQLKGIEAVSVVLNRPGFRGGRLV
ncbi:BPSL0761 family protein [Polaromonas sp. JS666]|uniref:BPSL0761 family protein n=1 Tax=Polaromonas sp. (strain JS666 / ATCC BAA-500) TaxID=296591 RepID=UPI0000533764|nr:BPSL0761 family protein [Polaromonas sp. JS666]ABE47067.1 hypothetical protein Bpro_5205 [Polaromonas sp. JS666]